MTTLPHPLFTVTVETGPGTVRLRIGGDLDYDTSGELAAQAETCLDTHGPDVLHLDCANLRLCDSMGVSTLLQIHRGTSARGVRLHLDDPPPFLERILTVTGIRGIFETRVTGEQADQAHVDEAARPAPPRTPSG